MSLYYPLVFPLLRTVFFDDLGAGGPLLPPTSLLVSREAYPLTSDMQEVGALVATEEE